jgi:Zn-dependent peptidase ImmA (M78 family)/transcriptional regulator with XRE-family HTH domain
MDSRDKDKDIDDLLNKILSEGAKSSYYALEELFSQRLAALDITKHQALKIMGIDHKTLNAILAGDARKLDIVTILKLSDFLEVPHDELLYKYFELVKDTHSETIGIAKKRSFLVNHFNLPSLKKIGLIDSINDFDHIEERIKQFLGYDNIFEHDKHKITAAFSSGKRATNKENLSFWYAAACQSLEKTPNPYPYDRGALKEYFPQIRWHSMNEDIGLQTVAQALFKLGITLVWIPRFTQDLHVRGATLAFRDKPCIVLTNYTRFYATLWFTLIHELFHVLYDWDEIKNEKYHISGETDSVKINEEEANEFARQYLFSYEKMETVKPHIDNPLHVKKYAEQNHVHPSIIYTFYCWDNKEEKAYAKFNDYMPSIDGLMKRFSADEFLNFVPVKEVSNKRNLKLYNSI